MCRISDDCVWRWGRSGRARHIVLSENGNGGSYIVAKAIDYTLYNMHIRTYILWILKSNTAECMWMQRGAERL